MLERPVGAKDGPLRCLTTIAPIPDIRVVTDDPINRHSFICLMTARLGWSPKPDSHRPFH